MMGGLLPSPGTAPHAPSRLPFLLAAIVGPPTLVVFASPVGGAFRAIAVGHLPIREAWLPWGFALAPVLLLLAALWLAWRLRVQRFMLERNAYDVSTRLLDMFAGNSEATLLVESDGRIEAANAAAGNLLGYDTEDIIGRNVVRLFDLDDGPDFQTRIGLADGRLARPYWPDRTARDRDGRDIAVDMALSVLNLPDGSHLVMQLRDIAERKTLERLKDEFLATISHELRTPLTSVVGALGLLRKGSAGALPAPADRLVEIAENNSRRLIRLVNDLLDIEKIGSGRMRFERGSLDLVHVAEAAIEGALGVAEERRVRIELAAPDRPWIVQGDHDRLL